MRRKENGKEQGIHEEQRNAKQNEMKTECKRSDEKRKLTKKCERKAA